MVVHYSGVPMMQESGPSCLPFLSNERSFGAQEPISKKAVGSWPAMKKSVKNRRQSTKVDIRLTPVGLESQKIRFRWPRRHENEANPSHLVFTITTPSVCALDCNTCLHTQKASENVADSRHTHKHTHTQTHTDTYMGINNT